MLRFFKQLFCRHDYEHSWDVVSLGEMDCYSACKKCGKRLFNGVFVR